MSNPFAGVWICHSILSKTTLVAEDPGSVRWSRSRRRPVPDSPRIVRSRHHLLVLRFRRGAVRAEAFRFQPRSLMGALLG
jgi:hypothetical protein